MITSPTLQKIFVDHPQTVGENYTEHFLVAMSFALRLGFASIVCLVHAFVPCLFTRTASGIIDSLYDEMVTHRAECTQKTLD